MTQGNSGAKCYKLQSVLSQYRFSGNQKHSLIPNRVYNYDNTAES